jgi:dolichol-phosphate mannosyltransferase
MIGDGSVTLGLQNDGKPSGGTPDRTVGAARSDYQRDETFSGMVAELTIVVPTYAESENVLELVKRLKLSLAAIAWEVIFVDDDSPDGTAALVKSVAATDPHVRCIRRVGRRGLSGACIEGMLASASPVVAVIDADLQHDETLLPHMLQSIRNGADLSIATRYSAGGSVGHGLPTIRLWGSRLATWLASAIAGTDVSDPMSGFFMIRRDVIEGNADALAREGYKLLLDILWTTGKSLKISEMSYTFRERRRGNSKLGALVTIDYIGLLFSKMFGGALPVRFLMFAGVGLSGVAVHLATLNISLAHFRLSFEWAQFSAVIVAMTWNFVLNNFLTYRDARLAGARFLKGLLLFYFACSIGSIGNVGVASWIYSFHATAWIAGLAGAIVGSVFNYTISSAMIWKRK